MPNKRDVIKLNGCYVAKRHLLLTKDKAFQKFNDENSDYPFLKTTFKKAIPRHIKVMKINHRRVCICVKDYNMEQKVTAVNNFAASKNVTSCITTLSKLSELSLCPKSGKVFHRKTCIERECKNCGLEKIYQHYEPLFDYNESHIKWIEWEQVEASYTNKKGNQVNYTQGLGPGAEEKVTASCHSGNNGQNGHIQ